MLKKKIRSDQRCKPACNLDTHRKCTRRRRRCRTAATLGRTARGTGRTTGRRLARDNGSPPHRCHDDDLATCGRRNFRARGLARGRARAGPASDTPYVIMPLTTMEGAGSLSGEKFVIHDVLNVSFLQVGIPESGMRVGQFRFVCRGGCGLGVW